MKDYGNEQLKALFKLLETESDTYGSVLKKELAAAIKHNPDGVQTVMEEQFKSSAPKATVLHTLEEICWEDLSVSLARFAAKINPDLEEGLVLVSKFVRPACTRQTLAQPLDEMAKEIRPALLNAKSYMEIASFLGHYFFNICRIKTLQANMDVKDICFSRFLQKKTGSSLCVACLYVCIGHRYGLDVGLIDLAGRILIKLKDAAEGRPFFIDPLDNGKILSERDCREYIQDRQIAWNGDFLSPLSSRLIVRRFIANMIFVLNKVRDERRLKFLREYLDILKS